MELNDNDRRILKDKKIILGVTGGIAAYKAAYICSMLVKAKARIFPVFTDNALNFISPVTLSAISGNKAITGMFENQEKIYHVDLAQSSDAILIAPASANTISKIACGICDNFLTTAVAASKCPVLIAPAMNERMWSNPIIQENIIKLRELGNYFFCGPSEGYLACGSAGMGRLEKEEKIIENLIDLLNTSNDLNGKNVLITAGGTKESIDAVRYISNYSSGKMGYALAAEAKFRGAQKVILISACQDMGKAYGADTYFVNTTKEMKEKILEFFDGMDVIIMAAAVSDIIPEKTYEYKLKKNQDLISKIKFIENENILKILSGLKSKKQVLVGFAAESGENIEYGLEKIKRNKIDMIVVNDISRNDIGFKSDYNEVVIIDYKGEIKKIAKEKKRIIAREIINEIIKKLD
ncbi:MAG: bifunctional phosphopantothenoylcysteine decarboxylase/phosphopantothenate--cysteine ligase CoaBC [Actinomycetota bacterium]|nr:bifunctional phosphopantothenoylcysteine decarboxylase/phosphopantothenate--cysteine ligase CoaBC [Actinomycetota bacterium]